MKPLRFLLLPVICSAVLNSCQKKSADMNVDQPGASLSTDNNMVAPAATTKVYVNNTEELYEAINNPANEGASIQLASGTYMLAANHPHGGRLEFQHNMTLSGEAGHPEEVIIDASQLPASSFIVPPTPTYPVTLRTGVVRMGNGYNAFEWITLRNDPAHSIRSLIQTDLVTTPVTNIKIAHSVISGASIGISIVNRDAVSQGRTIEALFEDNEVVGNAIPSIRAGIQIQNSQGTRDATINVILRRNYIHNNGSGVSAFNGSSSHSSIAIKSYSDRVEANGLGLNLSGGFGETSDIPTEGNSTTFEAYGTSVRNNLGTPLPYVGASPGGVLAAGGLIPATTGPGSVNNNKLQVSFWGSVIDNNIGDFNVRAFGAYSNNPATFVGSNNSAVVSLNGVSKQTTAAAYSSFPAQMGGNNTATILK